MPSGGKVLALFHCSVKVGKRGNGSAHAEYVSRSGAYENYKNGEDLVHSQTGNMPEWSKSPSDFFRAADLYERKNGSSYREYELALPRELSPEQRKALVEEFIKTEVGNRPYLYGIHSPVGMDGLENPHVHIMTTDRVNDGIARGPEQFFKRYNSKNPELGGAQKTNFTKTHKERKADLVALRGRWAEMQNRYLEGEAFPERVTHLSLAAQGIDRLPEKKIGPKRIKEPEVKMALLAHRDASSRSSAAREEAKPIVDKFKQEKDHATKRNLPHWFRQRGTGHTHLQDVRRIDDLPTIDNQKRLLQHDARDHLGLRQAQADSERVHKLEEQGRRGRRLNWCVKHYNAPGLSLDGSAPQHGKPGLWRTTDEKKIPLVIDYGNRLKATGKPEKAAGKAGALVAVAKLKGWQTIVVSGDSKFQEAVAREAIKQGVQLADKELMQRVQKMDALAAEAKAQAAREAQAAKPRTVEISGSAIANAKALHAKAQEARLAAEAIRQRANKVAPKSQEMPPAPTPSPQSKPLPAPQAQEAPQSPSVAIEQVQAWEAMDERLKGALAAAEKELAALPVGDSDTSHPAIQNRLKTQANQDMPGAFDGYGQNSFDTQVFNAKKAVTAFEQNNTRGFFNKASYDKELEQLQAAVQRQEALAAKANKLLREKELAYSGEQRTARMQSALKRPKLEKVIQEAKLNLEQHRKSPLRQLAEERQKQQEAQRLARLEEQRANRFKERGQGRGGMGLG